MDPVALARAADANLATQFTWIQSHTTGMRVIRATELTVTISGLPSDNFNAACGARIDPLRADRRVPEWLAWLDQNAGPFAWWVGITDQPADLGPRLLELGLELSEREIALTLELKDGPPVPATDLTIRRARTPIEIGDFARVSTTNYAPADPWVATFYDRAAEPILSLEAPLWLYVGYLDQVPVACAQVTVGGGIAGLYNVATLVPHRRRGFGAAIVAHALAEARGAGLTTAILQVADPGVELYQRLGFRTFGEIAEYRRPARRSAPTPIAP